MLCGRNWVKIINVTVKFKTINVFAFEQIQYKMSMKYNCKGKKGEIPKNKYKVEFMQINKDNNINHIQNEIELS